jgi:hypothetical protein
MEKSAVNQLLNKVALVAGTRLVNFQASAATYFSADLLRPQIELPGKLGRASAIYFNKKLTASTTGFAVSVAAALTTAANMEIRIMLR